MVNKPLTFGLELGHFGLELVRRSAALSALELELGVFEEVLRLVGHFQALQVVPPLAPLTVEQIVGRGRLTFVEDALTALAKVAKLGLLEALEAEAEVVVERFEEELLVVEDVVAMATLALEAAAAYL